MQYLYTQEEHDRIATDKAAFDIQVQREVDRRVSVCRTAAKEVLKAFAKEFRVELGNPYGLGHATLYRRLVQLSDDISAAIDWCDKPASGVIQST